MKPKEIYTKVAEFRKVKKSKPDIFNALKEEVSEDYTLAKIVASFPDFDLEAKYKNTNTILFILLVLTCLLKALFAIPLLFSISAYALPFALVIPIINIFLAVEVYKKRGYVYRVVGLFSLYGIFQALPEFIKNYHILKAPIMLLSISICILSFYLAKKMFPNFKFSGPQKDIDGVYKL